MQSKIESLVSVPKEYVPRKYKKEYCGRVYSLEDFIAERLWGKLYEECPVLLWGLPASGKTTTALYLAARYVHENKKAQAICILFRPVYEIKSSLIEFPIRVNDRIEMKPIVTIIVPSQAILERKEVEGICKLIEGIRISEKSDESLVGHIVDAIESASTIKDFLERFENIFANTLQKANVDKEVISYLTSSFDQVLRATLPMTVTLFIPQILPIIIIILNFVFLFQKLRIIGEELKEKVSLVIKRIECALRDAVRRYSERKKEPLKDVLGDVLVIIDDISDAKDIVMPLVSLLEESIKARILLVMRVEYEYLAEILENPRNLRKYYPLPRRLRHIYIPQALDCDEFREILIKNGIDPNELDGKTTEVLYIMTGGFPGLAILLYKLKGSMKFTEFLRTIKTYEKAEVMFSAYINQVNTLKLIARKDFEKARRFIEENLTIMKSTIYDIFERLWLEVGDYILVFLITPEITLEKLLLLVRPIDVNGDNESLRRLYKAYSILFHDYKRQMPEEKYPWETNSGKLLNFVLKCKDMLFEDYCSSFIPNSGVEKIIGRERKKRTNHLRYEKLVLSIRKEWSYVFMIVKDILEHEEVARKLKINKILRNRYHRLKKKYKLMQEILSNMIPLMISCPIPQRCEFSLSNWNPKIIWFDSHNIES